MAYGLAIAIGSVPYFHSTFLLEISASLASRGLASEASRGPSPYYYYKM